MEGKTTIQLFDIENNKVYETTEKNFITNAYKNCVEAYLKNSLCDDYKELFVPFLSFKPSDLSGGMVLWEEPIKEDVDVTMVGRTPVAYASCDYTGVDVKRGTLNPIESGPLTAANDIVGHKWVWDFPTSAGNCTFRCVSLTNPNFGSNSIDQSIVFRRESNIVEESEVKKILRRSYSKNGEIYEATKSGYKRIIKKQVDYNGTILDTAENNFIITDYSNFSRPHIINNFIYIIAKNSEDGMFKLLKLEKDTTNILAITSLELEGSNLKIINDFGMAGKYILFNPTIEGITCYDTEKNIAYLFSPAYNMLKKEEEIKATIFNNFFYDGQHYCSVGYAQDSIGGFDLLLNPDLQFTTIDTSKEKGYITNCIEGLPIGLAFSFGEEEIKEGMKILDQTLFTVNNLSRQVTKTPLNTMKITYTLKW